MEKYKKLLSIIIPTKNRYECLIPVVSTLLKYIENDNIELIIQDNSDDNTLGFNYFKNINDNRVFYEHMEGQLSIKENTELAIKNANGEYITFIGDDDLVSPYIVEIVLLMSKNNIQSLIYNPGKYWWDNVGFKKTNHYFKPKSFWIPKRINTEFIKLNSEFELDFMLNHGCLSTFRLPRFYHGIIKRALLLKIKDKTSISPDISYCTALSLVCNEHYYINYPVSVFGASKNSGGGMTMEKKHYGKIEDQPWLPKDTLSIWDEMIPKIWSEHTAYPVSVFHVLNQFGVKKNINYNVFYSSMFVYEFYLFKFLKPKIIEFNIKNKFGYLNLIYQIIRRYAGLILNKIKINFKLLNFVVFDNFTIEDCMDELKKIKIKIEGTDL